MFGGGLEAFTSHCSGTEESSLTPSTRLTAHMRGFHRQKRNGLYNLMLRLGASERTNEELG